jgi:hypothetical protein
MQFYAYLWLRADGTPYYAGKGKGFRAYAPHRHIYPPTDKNRIVIFYRDSEEAAFETEKELIRNWGRKDLGSGCLRNRTDGGDGLANPSEALRQKLQNPSPETRAKLSAKTKANWASGNRPPISEAERIRRSFAAQGVKPSLATRAKLSAVRRGRKLSPEHRANISLGLRGKTPSLETRAKLSAAKRGNTNAKKSPII